MLINLSNHPQAFWVGAQKLQANQLYGEIVDVPFPNVSPTASSNDIKEQAEALVLRLTTEYGNSNPTFHIMGEMTFCFHLINKLKAAGYTCIASTTTRAVTYAEDGTKNVQFNFVKFREY